MKKLLIGLLFISSFQFAVEAREALRADDVILVRDGKVVDTGILSDENGTIFLEFIKGDFVNYEKDKQPFTGEILPPALIDMPIKLPRHRMREILTFELLTDNVETVTFVDRYSLMHPKEYLRETIKNPNGLIHGNGIKVLTRIYDKDKVGLPSLWFLETEKNSVLKTKREKYWKKVGGTLIETEEPGVKVFSAVLNRTGVYGLFDENPTPYYSPNTPLETIEKAEESPFPSVVPQKPLPPAETKPFEENTQDEGFYFDNNDNLQLVPAVSSSQRESALTNVDDRIIPAIQTPIEVAPNTQPRKIPPVNDFQDLQANDPNIQTLPVTGANTTTPSSSFPFILLLAFGLLGGSFYLAFKKQY